MTYKKMLAAFSGTIIVYYAYSLYGFSGTIIAAKFFSPNISSGTALIRLFQIYAVAYLAKPLGAFIFGYIGDHFGRKKALQISILGSAFPPLLIGILPEYIVIGSWATFVLILSRFFEGIFVAGEVDGASIYLLEHMGNKKCYTTSALANVSWILGILCAVSAINLCGVWWRIPFLLSAPIAFVAYYLRQWLDESIPFLSTKERSPLSWKKLMHTHKKLLLLIVLLTGGIGASFQISIIFMQYYMDMLFPKIHHMLPFFSVCWVLCYGIGLVSSGMYADAFGKHHLLRFSIFFSFFSIVSLIFCIKTQNVFLAIFSVTCITFSISPLGALSYPMLLERIFIQERYRTISVGHTIGSMIFSGLSNYLCASLVEMWTLFPMILLLGTLSLAYISLFLSLNIL